MNSNKVFAMFLVLSSGFLAGCGGEADEPLNPQYVLNFPGNQWHVTVWLNGEPVQSYSGLGLLGNLTAFVIDGKNTVRIGAERKPSSGSPGDCDVRFCKFTGDPRHPDNYETLGGFYKEDSSEGDVFEHEFEFEAAVPFRWTWQDAEEIGEFTDDDRKAVLELIDATADIFRRRAWRELESPDSLRVTFSPTGKSLNRLLYPFLEKTWPDLDEKLAGYDDYTVTVAPPEAIQFDFGLRVVHVFPRPDPRVRARGFREIICGGPASAQKSRLGDMFYTRAVSEAFFAKIGGRWCLLF